MRKHLLRYRWIVVPVAVVLMLFAWARTYRTIVPAQASGYYYDLSTGDLFVAGGGQTGVITSPSGNEAVKAAVYACGQCGDESDQFVAYLEKATPEAIEQMSLPIGERTNPDAIESGMWLSLPTTPPNWVPSSSGQAQMIRDAPHRKCASDGGETARCAP